MPQVIEARSPTSLTPVALMSGRLYMCTYGGYEHLMASWSWSKPQTPEMVLLRRSIHERSSLQTPQGRSIPPPARLMLTAITTYHMVADACTEMTNSKPKKLDNEQWWDEYHDLKQRLYLIDAMMGDSIWIDLVSWCTYVRTIERRLQHELNNACVTPDEEPTF